MVKADFEIVEDFYIASTASSRRAIFRVAKDGYANVRLRLLRENEDGDYIPVAKIDMDAWEAEKLIDQLPGVADALWDAVAEWVVEDDEDEYEE